MSLKSLKMSNVVILGFAHAVSVATALFNGSEIATCYVGGYTLFLCKVGPLCNDVEDVVYEVSPVFDTRGLGDFFNGLKVGVSLPSNGCGVLVVHTLAEGEVKSG